jgi:hypothetical protein
MDVFCAHSGQSVNFDKSKLYCSPNVCRELATEISNTCGSPLTNDLGKYLGMPLIHSRVSKSTYSDLIDKVQSRLAGWKSNSLSMAGRLTLLQAVNASIPIYAMQTAKLPISTCDSLDKLNRDFLWGDSDGKKKIHLVKWDTVCKPKAAGGLGIKKTMTMNRAMLAKTGWRILQQDEGLWCSIFKLKYLNSNSLLNPSYQKPALCSSTWSSICFGASLLRQGLYWRIGNGESAHFWTDNWSGCGTLCNFALDPSIIDEALLVHDFWVKNEWDETLLYACLPSDIVTQILCIPLSCYGYNDKLIWKHSPTGIFSVKSAYTSSIVDPPVSNGPWKSIWRLNVPPKLKVFAWLFYQGRLLTNVYRAKRNIVADSSCHYCLGTPESMLHLFRDCPKASQIWRALGGPVTMMRTFTLDWNGWLSANIFQKNCSFLGFQWVQLFVFTCWFIWKWRNKRIFDVNFHDPHNAIQLITHYIMEWNSVNQKGSSDSLDCVQLLSWQRPSCGSFKLNVDGTRSLHGSIGAGGVIRDHNGEWRHGFMRNVGTGEVLQAEAWGLFSGLQMAKDLGLSHVVVETDSAVLVNLLNSPELDFHPLGTLLLNCKHIMNWFVSCSLSHIYRERNMVADGLAKRSVDQDLGICMVPSAPDFIIPALLDDIAGVAHPRT